MHRGFCRLFPILLLLLVLCTPTAFPQQVDPTFGNNGVVFTTLPHFSNDPLPRSTALGLNGFPTPTGGIAVLAKTEVLYAKLPQSYRGMSLVNYGENGGGATIGPRPNETMFTSDAAQQPDGKVVAVGSANANWFIWRFDPGGLLDSSFNSNGMRVIGFGAANSDVATNVLVQPDGKILVSGYSVNSSDSTTLVMRLNPDGTNDASFGPSGNGVVLIFDNTVFAQKMVLRPNGKILLMNMSLAPDNETKSSFFQLNSDGSTDTGFGDGGLAYAFEPHRNMLAETITQPDGKLLVLATREYDVPEGTFIYTEHEIVLTRYNLDGSIDTSFGLNGKNVVNTSPPYTGVRDYEPSGSEAARGMVIDSTGKINVVAVSGQVAPENIVAGFGGHVGRLQRKYVQYILQFDTSGHLVGRNFSGQSKHNQIAASHVTIQINGIFEQPGKGLVTVGSSPEVLYYHWPSFTNGNSIMLARFTSISAVNNANALYDYNFDGQADFPTYRSNASGFSKWMFNRSQVFRDMSYGAKSYDFGLGGDVPVPGDYDGDGVQDLAVFRDGEGDWFTRKIYLDRCAPMGCTTQVHWGQAGDIPAPGDFDGDGKTDRAIFRPASGDWYILYSSGGYAGLHFGQNGDLPVTGDYDDDGRSDVAVIRREGGQMTWYILQSSNNGFVGIPFGLTADKAVPADYNGDGKTEIAVFRPSDGYWYMLSNYADFSYGRWGMNGDIPAPADYDGDQKADLAVFRPSDATHYVLRSHAATQLAYTSGSAGDIPIASAYVR